MSVISNTTVISNFAQVDQLEMLRQLYGLLYISAEVYSEIQTGLAEGYQFYQNIEQQVHPIAPDGWIQLTSMLENELALFASLPSRLHPGESSCIAIAKHRNWTILTDDNRARREALKLGIRVSGTVGSLLLSIERQICSPEYANTSLQHMIERGYRSPVGDLSLLIS